LPLTGEKVVVRVRPDGSLSILWKEKILLVEELPPPKKKAFQILMPLKKWGKGSFLLRLDIIKEAQLTKKKY
jgi:hypothetical protein